MPSGETVKGVGTDLIRIKRVADACRRRPVRFLRRIFTDKEIELLLRKKRPFPSMAARFAAKEAVAKALGCGIGLISWREIEIYFDPLGSPRVLLRGKAALWAEKREIRGVKIAMSHDGLYATASAVAF
ncbi:MAG TPA: holo-ACP synthase [Firmicutes bacterium]|jgi:holo-[acyl-carrier protein] synthase|nr:holo-ACP synthase [Bacillota bacterium]